MANRDLVAIGASAGGVEALLFLAKNFPADFPARVLVTIHLSRRFPSTLDGILDRAGPLPAGFAEDGQLLQASRIYIAPPDRHLIVEGDRLRLGIGPRENNARPAIDPMLRSAAMCCGPRTIGVVLTGTLGDGASGLWALNRCAGMTVVQDPDDAAFSEMPLNALSRLRPNHVVGLAEMPDLLAKLTTRPAGDFMPVPKNLEFEVAIAKGIHSGVADMDRVGRRSGLACPDCHGALWEIDEGDLVRYRCHVGHTYTAELLSIALEENLRRAMGGALRALEERRTLAKGLQQQAERADQRHLAVSWAERADEIQRELEVIRDSVRRLDALGAREGNRKAAAE